MPPEPHRTAPLRYVAFRAGGLPFGVRASWLETVLPLADPAAPRRRLDLAALLDLGSPASRPDHLVVLRLPEGQTALEAEGAPQLATVPAEALRPIPAVALEPRRNPFEGVLVTEAGTLIYLLDLRLSLSGAVRQC
jgi:hypothetical protein